MGNWMRMRVPESVPEDRAARLRGIGVAIQGIRQRKWRDAQVMPDYTYDVSLLGLRQDPRHPGYWLPLSKDGTVASRRDSRGEKEFLAEGVPGATWRERLWQAVEDLLEAGA